MSQGKKNTKARVAPWKDSLEEHEEKQGFYNKL